MAENKSQIQMLKKQLSTKKSLAEQMYHYEKAKREEAARKAKIAAENQVKESRSRASIVRERIAKFTEKNKRQLFLRAEKPIAKKKEKLAKSKLIAKTKQETRNKTLKPN